MHIPQPGSAVLMFDEIDRTHVGSVGGKGASLGELSRLGGVRVPAGFCVTTDAFRRITADVPGIGDRLDRLSRVGPADTETLRAVSADVRRAIEAVEVPDDVAAAVTRAMATLGEQAAYAVRSSATAEDLPTASFAGQHDTYLNVVGPAAVLRHVTRCWASLFTERAVSYRVRHRIDDADVAMAVVVQHMVVADAAGVMFTADPVTSNRKVVCVEATFGLGEALVAGRVNPDVYTVRDGEVVARSVGRKQLAIRASRGGGTHEQAIAPARQERPVLRDADVARLAHLGRRIEAHLGRPQDIEWCLAGDEIQIVQSRPITTLFPVPVVGDGEDHVFVSVGHQQMMTDPMRPLGISMWQLTAGRPMHEAGGRLFVDVARGLADPVSRAGLLESFGKSDPLIADALQTIVDRAFLPSFPDEDPGARPPNEGGSMELETDPAIVRELIDRTEASVAAVRREIRDRSGEALIDFILADVAELRRTLFDPRSLQVVMAGMEARWWLDDHLREWLDEPHAADPLTQSVPDNVTSEMGLALLDVADAVRPHPEVVAFLRDVTDEGFLDDLPELAGGRAARDAIRAYLGRFGMRCVGEIDITRPRWSERPSTLLPLVLGHVDNVAAGERERRFERGRQEAARKERELLARVRALPDGEHKADEAKRMIDRLRTFSGYREHPKYGMISRYAVYRQALVEEAARLVDAGVLRDRDDIFFLTLPALLDVVRTGHVDHELIARRREAFRSYHALTPPRVLTSDGEVVTGSYRRDDVPPGALIGLAVSAGTIEGRARVVVDIAEADLRAGDILVTAFTDPSWSPLFVAIGGLVTEAGGLMTHGAVIAREYGIPAVVGVEHATRLVRDGQRIRVDGTRGHVEILPAAPAPRIP